MSMPMVEPSASGWQELTAEILWKLVDVLQTQDATVSAFATKPFLSSFKHVCSHWRQAARVGQRHLDLKTCKDGDIRALLGKYVGAQSLKLPGKGTPTERTISALQEFPRIRFLDVSYDRSAVSIKELVQLEGVTTMMAWFHNSQEQLGKWRLCTVSKVP
ncbi:hypothetical protein WJX79_005498 [Trebouxia sp. C0005]